MGILGFDPNEFISYSQTNQARRNDRISSNLSLLREEMEMQKEYEKSAKEIESKMVLEESAKGLVNTKTIERRKRLHEDAVLKEDLTRKVFVGYLTEMTMSGLVFDKDFYYRQENYLREELTKFYNKAFDENVLSENSFIKSDNVFLQEAYFELKDKIDELIKNRDSVDIFNEDTVLSILQEAPKSKDLSDEVADVVKGKVEDTLENEKKISKKKEEEKKKDEKEKEADDAADSLDSNVDDDGTDSTDSEDDSDTSTDTDDDDNSEDTDDEIDEEEPSDEETEDDTEDIDDESDDDDNDSELSDDDLKDDTEDIDKSNDASDDTDDASSTDPSSASNNGTLKLTIETNGTNVTVSANKSESTEYFSIFGTGKYKERQSKSLFRNLLERTLNESVSMLNESVNSNNRINMDFVLAEAVVQYTLLESLYTSKLIDPSSIQVANLTKALNNQNK